MTLQSSRVPVAERARLSLSELPVLVLGKPWALFSIPAKPQRYEFVQISKHPPRVCVRPWAPVGSSFTA